MNIKVIEFFFNEVFEKSEFKIKCSNQYINNKLSSMSISDKKEKLKSLTNPLEKNDYDYLLEQKEMFEFIGDWENPYMVEEYDDVINKLFEYDKRIFRGYDLDKNKSNISDVNISDFKLEDIPEGMEEDNFNPNIYSLEQSQIDSDNKIIFSTEEVNSFKAYFGSHSTRINSELDSNYKEGFWSKLGDEERNNIIEVNKGIIPFMESGMDKCSGLVENTVLFHGVTDSDLVSIHTRIGDKIKLKSFISTSFHERVGKGYGKVVSGNGPRLYVRFLAKKGVRGVSGNKKGLSDYPVEHEFLLDKGQSGRVVDFNYDKSMITVLLD